MALGWSEELADWHLLDPEVLIMLKPSRPLGRWAPVPLMLCAAAVACGGELFDDVHPLAGAWTLEVTRYDIHSSSYRSANEQTSTTSCSGTQSVSIPSFSVGEFFTVSFDPGELLCSRTYRLFNSVTREESSSRDSTTVVLNDRVWTGTVSGETMVFEDEEGERFTGTWTDQGVQDGVIDIPEFRYYGNATIRRWGSGAWTMAR